MTTEAPKRLGRKGVPNHPIEFRRQLAMLACEPGVSVARLAMEHGLNANLVFKWRRSLRAGEYDLVDLLPVKVDMPTTEIALPARASAPRTTPTGTIEVSIGNVRIRIDGVPDDSTLTLVLRLLRGGAA